MSMYYDEAQARDLVVRAGHMLQERGLVERTWGNISARISDTLFVITPSGLAYEDLRPEQLALYDLSDGSWQGPCKPSSEKGIHADAYRLRPDISFVIHTHQDMASICGIKGEALDVGADLPGGKVPCAAYGLPSTGKLRRAVAGELEAEPRCQALLMRRHGALCLGRDMEEAFRLAAELEEDCARRFHALVREPEAQSSLPQLGDSFRDGDYFILKRGGQEQKCSIYRKNGDDTAELHAAIYKNFQAQCILHCRDPYVCQVSGRLRRLRPMLDDLAQIAGADILCVPAEAEKVLKALEGRSAVLLRECGALCLGEAPDEALAVQRLLEKGCRAQAYAWAVKGCRPLSYGDALLQRLIYVKKYSKKKQRG
ncbi:MAG TPA: class II aldolase/adducin family protein [Candidatus Limivicinus faecipullorum]|nr:class II aldolase/adducin family protein [Candidatus Limivicinus faecipullorum]